MANLLDFHSTEFAGQAKGGQWARLAPKMRRGDVASRDGSIC
jgi:hypothetical protein